jgi:hypothetical protein
MKKGPVQAAATPHRNPDLLKDQFQHSTGAYLLHLQRVRAVLCQELTITGGKEA